MSTQRKSKCGLKVSTWGSNVGAGNGMLHYLDSQWFGGSVGHASITLTIPAEDPKSSDLIKKYCTNPKIPYTKKKVNVKKTSSDKEIQIPLKGNETLFEEEVYEIHFSWWPPIQEGNKYDLAESLGVDNMEEWEGVNFEWRPELQHQINPQIRRYKKTLGETIMTFGPLVITHGRELEKEEQIQLAYSVANIKVIKEIESLDVLIEKLGGKGGKTDIKVGFTESNLLNRFVPNWKNSVKNPQILNNEERQILLKEIRQRRGDYNAATNRMENLNDLLQFNETILELLGHDPIDYGLLKKEIDVFGKSRHDIDKNKEIGRILFPIYNKIQKKIKGSEKISNEDIAQLTEKYSSKVKELKEKVMKALPSINFPNKSFVMNTQFDERYVTPGRPADNVVSLPLSKASFPAYGIGHANGLDAEEMLKKMQGLIQLDAEGFNLKTKNCSKTVGSILEAGAPDALKPIFQRKAFGFFGNPQEILNASLDYSTALARGGKISLYDRLRRVNPVERAGGFLLSVLYDDKASAAKKWAAGFTGTFIVAPIALGLFIVRKALNPLDSFRGAVGLLQYTYSKPSPKFFSGANFLKGVTTLFVGPFAFIIAPIAGGQYLVEKAVKSFVNLFKVGSEKQLKIEKEVERAYISEKSKMLGTKGSELVQEFDKEQTRRKEVDVYLSDSFKRDVVEVSVDIGSLTLLSSKIVKEKAIEAFRNFKQILKDPSQKDNVPIFSKSALKIIREFIKKGYKLPPDLSINNKGEQQSAKTLYQNLCAESLERSVNKQKSLLVHKQETPEFIVNSILAAKYAGQKNENSALTFTSTKQLSKEFDFLNKLKDILREDISFIGAEGLEKRASYLLNATELVFKQLEHGNQLSPRDRIILETEISKLKSISKEPMENNELETYLDRTSKVSGDRKLVSECHELINQAKLRSKTEPIISR